MKKVRGKTTALLTVPCSPPKTWEKKKKASQFQGGKPLTPEVSAVPKALKKKKYKQRTTRSPANAHRTYAWEDQKRQLQMPRARTPVKDNQIRGETRTQGEVGCRERPKPSRLCEAEREGREARQGALQRAPGSYLRPAPRPPSPGGGRC